MLDPAIQQFGIDAAAYLAGIDEMVSATDRLAEAVDEAMSAIAASVQEAAEAADRLAGSADEAMGQVGAASDEAAERSAQAADVMGSAMESAAARIGETVTGIAGVMGDLGTVVEETAARVAESGDELAASFEATAGASDRAAEMLDLAAESADRSVGAFDAAAAAADELTAALGRAADAADVEGASAARASAETEGMGAVMKTALLGVALAIGFGAEQAGKFQSTMATLSTQAGVAKSQLGYLSQGVLELAGQVGDSPDSLAQALYHIESSFASVGITGPKALSLLQIAAEGAAVGHANLVDVTNALDATIVAGVPGVTSYAQAMGVLNSIVGSGDMTMQDLANAMGSGVMAVAKSYGQSVYQVGAALAVLGDNNIRGAKAATDLRMAWQAIQSPLKTAGGALQQLGLTDTTLATTMTQHGLSAAITQFVQHLKDSKIPADQWGQYMTEIFGKKAGVGIGVLTDQLGRLDGKFPVLKKGASGFGDAWQATQATLSQQWKQLLGSLDALAISFGDVLLPPLTAAFKMLAKVGVWLEKHKDIAAFAGAIIAVAVAFGIAAEMGKLFEAVTSASPEMLILMAVILLAAGLYELYKHFKSVRDVVADVGHFFEGAWGAAVRAAGAVTKWFVDGPLKFIRGEIAAFRGWWASNSKEIYEVWHAVWTAISAVALAWWSVLKGEFTVGMAIVKAVWKTGWDFIRDEFKTDLKLITGVIRDGLSDIGSVISIALDILTGHWSKAWDAIKGLPGKVLGQIATLIGGYISGIGKTITDLGGGIVSGIASVWDSVFGASKSGAGKAGAGAAGAFATGWDAVYRDTVGEVVRAFEDVKSVITSGFDGWWKTHGKAIEEVWHAVWSEIARIFTAEWDAFMAVAKPAFGLVVAILAVAWQDISLAAKIAWDLVAAYVKTAWDVIAAIVKVGADLVVAIAKTAWDVLMAVVKVAWAAITMVIKIAWDVIVGIFSVTLDLITGHWSQAWKDIQAVGVQVWNAIKGFLGTTLDAIWGLIRQVWNNVKGFLEQTLHAIEALFTQAFDHVKDFLVQTWNAIYNSVVSAWGAVNSFFHGVPGKILSALGDVGHLLWQAGVDIVDGLIGGIKSVAGKVTGIIGDLAHGNVIGAFSSAIGAMSPSKVFYKLGTWITQGLANGIVETTAAAAAKARALAAAVKQAYADGQITQDEEESYLDQISDAIAERKDKLASAMKKLGLEMGAGMLSSLEDATSASTAKTAVDKLISYVQQAWSAGDISTSKASSMTAWLEADNSRLQSLAAQRQTLAATIKTAVAFANTTTSNTESWAGLSNVTSSMTSGGMVYSGNILSGMQADLSSINQFTAAIRKLGKMGLRKDLINQIIQMGPGQGLQVAEALLNGPAKVITEMNSTQAAIASGSSALGQAAANAMYDTGAAAGKGFLSGLQAQESQVTAMMDRVAKSMAATLRRELGEGGGSGAAAGMQVHVTVNGFVGSNAELTEQIRKELQQAVLQYNRRNGKNGLSLTF
jgi:TP901 family phage tail tape measure protein